MAISQRQVRERIQAILEAMPGVNFVITDDNCPLSPEQLPAVLVLAAGRATRERRSRDIIRVTRRWIIVAYLTHVCNTSPEEQRAAIDAAEDLIEVIPDYFSSLDRLSLNRQLLHGVIEVAEMTDGGLITTARSEGKKTVVYNAALYELAVTTAR